MTAHDLFLSHLQEHVEAVCRREDALQPFRRESWDRLQAVGLASKAHPALRSVPVKALYQERFVCTAASAVSPSSLEGVIHPECRHSRLVFVNGRFSMELSDLSALPQSLVLSSLEQGLLSHGGFLRKMLGRTRVQKTPDPFALLNLSLSQDGAFLYIPPHICIETPMQILHLTTAELPQVTAPRLQLALGEGSTLSCLLSSHQTHQSVAHLSVPVLEISLEAQARLHLAQTLTSSWLFQSIHATLKRQARLVSVHGDIHRDESCRVVRQNYSIELKEEGAEADLSGIALLDCSQTAHTAVHIEHQAPHTRSMQLFKAVLDGLSRSHFSGRIVVDPEAQKTEAYQLNKTLLLSAHAQVTSEPNLEIGADDVKASHGSTVAQLDEQQLFYFQTRGIDRDRASRLLVDGFCQEVLQKMRHKNLFPGNLPRISLGVALSEHNL